MDRLSNEILTKICNHVQLAHQPSLVSFALVNKHYYFLARDFLYERITIPVPEPTDVGEEAEHASIRKEDLAETVQQGLVGLQRDEAFGRVRALVIEARPDDLRTLYSYGSNTGRDARETAWKDNSEYDAGLRGGLLEDDRLDGLQCAEINYYRPVRLLKADNSVWTPLVELLPQLTGLTDFVFLSNEQFPSVLLKILHRDRPRSEVESDDEDDGEDAESEQETEETATDDVELDEHDRLLVTSPSLYRFGMCLFEDYGEAIFPVKRAHKAILSMVSGGAPNLKAVSSLAIWRFPKFHRRLFKMNPHDQGGPPLEELSLWSGWRRPLREDIVEYYNLTSVTTLALSMVDLEWDYDGPGPSSKCKRRTPACIEEDAGWFLCGLPKVSSLLLDKWQSKLSLGAILPVNLRKLFIRDMRVRYDGSLGWACTDRHLWLLDPAAIKNLANVCLLLDEVGLSMFHSCGDAKEVAIHRAFGALPRLRHPILRLKQPGFGVRDLASDPLPLPATDLDLVHRLAFMDQQWDHGIFDEDSDIFSADHNDVPSCYSPIPYFTHICHSWSLWRHPSDALATRSWQ
ncbi:hypothetical protein B0H63DRAFT_564136 [Podospora didyma]|uniref:F-box domain-containing protein n=1 Tax=Podospora didyma TaxID=330526 RepID=A0AAE0K574_9PEZI|nr:hypothetical protein B0H63DRAFT_564136 [Podospora didyma]